MGKNLSYGHRRPLNLQQSGLKVSSFFPSIRLQTHFYGESFIGRMIFREVVKKGGIVVLEEQKTDIHRKTIFLIVPWISGRNS